MYAVRTVPAPLEIRTHEDGHVPSRGTYRRVCNHCKWLYYVKPSRDRRILRELEQRHKK